MLLLMQLLGSPDPTRPGSDVSIWAMAFYFNWGTQPMVSLPVFSKRSLRGLPIAVHTQNIPEYVLPSQKVLEVDGLISCGNSALGWSHVT